LRSDGYFNSISNTVSWFTATTQQLENVAPGDGGTVRFSVRVKNVFPIKLFSDKNYTLKVDARLESPTVPPNITAEKTISVDGTESKVAGRVEVSSEAYWRDAQSGILNSGPYPPKVNQPTQYTIHWILRNYATDINNVSFSAFLKSGAVFTGKVKSNVNNLPSYNPSSGRVTWQIDSLAANKGVISPPAEAVFQIEVTPAVNQVNRNVPLISETTATWTDAFTGEELRVSAPELDSSLPYDKTILYGDNTVKL
ncbi:MAG: hypothetical protein AAB655_02430, partial [Patescibacteria group bacterium]